MSAKKIRKKVDKHWSDQNKEEQEVEDQSKQMMRLRGEKKERVLSSFGDHDGNVGQRSASGVRRRHPDRWRGRGGEKKKGE